MANQLSILAQQAEYLDSTLKHMGKRNEARQLYLLWPKLKTASQKLCGYITPLVIVEERPLLEHILARAIDAAVGECHQQQFKAFVGTVAVAAQELRGHQISIQDSDDNWIIWDFERPILELLREHGREAVQVRPRASAFDAGAVTLAVLTRVFTIKDLMLADLGLDVRVAPVE